MADLDKLASKYGGQASTNAVDFDALAAKHGASTKPIGSANAPQPQQLDMRPWSEKIGIGPGPTLPSLEAVRAGVDLAEGAVSGLASTAFNANDLIERGMNAVGINRQRSINDPRVQRAITPPSSMPGKVGYYGEQAAEFAVPLSKVSTAMRGAKLLPKVLAEGASSAGVAALQTGGDPGAVIAGSLGGAAFPVASKIAGAGAGTVRRMAAGAQEGGLGGAMAGAIRQVADSTPVQKLTQALKPRNSRLNFEDSVQVALPELKASEAAIGKPIQGADDLLEAITDAKKRVWSQIEEFAGPQREMGAQVDLNPVADAIENSITETMRMESPEAIESLYNLANRYRMNGGKVSLQKAEKLLKEANASSDSFFAKYPQGQRSALTADPEARLLQAKADALRTQIYQMLDGPGGGTAIRELKHRYGALMEIEDPLYRRLLVARRQQPESLSEQLAGWSGAADLGRGAYKMARGLFGDLPSAASGVADVISGHTKRATSRFIKDQQKMDTLIRRAMQGAEGTNVKVSPPPPFFPKGLLPRGPVRVGPVADPSSVRAVKPNFLVDTDYRTGKLKTIFQGTEFPKQ